MSLVVPVPGRVRRAAGGEPLTAAARDLGICPASVEVVDLPTRWEATEYSIG